jgi:hypothetical protein
MKAGSQPDNFVSSLTIKQIIMTTKISYSIALLLGLGMIFLGSRFFFLPK